MESPAKLENRITLVTELDHANSPSRVFLSGERRGAQTDPRRLTLASRGRCFVSTASSEHEAIRELSLTFSALWISLLDEPERGV